MARILLVEDEHHLAQGLRFNLEADGHAVTLVGDGESALQRLDGERGAFDIVILDVMLPGTRRLRGGRRCCGARATSCRS